MAQILKRLTITLGIGVVAPVAHAQDAMQDPLFGAQVFQLNLGIAAPANSLQETLTYPNGGGATILTTGSLDFGTGGRAEISYSRPWGDASRFYVELAGMRAIGEETILIVGPAATFPGSYDDGYQLPTGYSVATDVKTEMAFLKAGREWAMNDTWRASAGVQVGQVSQEFQAESFDTALVSSRTLTATGSNQLFGVQGGLSHYVPLNEKTALRSTMTLGVMTNSYDYAYRNIETTGGATEQAADASGNSTAFSAGVSVALEHQMTTNGYLSFKVGVGGLFNVVNAADTFLDPAGTASTAKIDHDSIVSSYVTVGYVFRF
ncbi:hypothetical protein SULPSESMR1_01219 [Pseudosulfitobacter pseudonitzschiae]|uniref:MltA-interacting protein MipA n=2 Tax=Rhodobacterales TaxID=204455 RepID=A0A221JZ67_9RHOB|nr:hypothetical protein [Pseudosulfitobacter pseudonitzschiae]ASM72041.1 hypothetical protein SULPSESMR1_01219 [Pseudosulfitobacter pseudonitzschiae]